MGHGLSDPPLAPPPAPGPVAKRRTPVMLIAVSAVLLLMAGSLILSLGKGDSSPSTAKNRAGSTHQPSTEDASPAPTGSVSPFEAGLFARIKAIIADAHSDRYFSNVFEDTFSASEESTIVQGMESTLGKKASDEMLACIVSYVESTVRGGEAFPMDGNKVASKATAKCAKLGIKVTALV